MKNFLLMLALLPTILFAQPTKNKVDSVTLNNGLLFYWINGTKYLGGSLVDGRANFIIPNRNNVSTGFRNNLFGWNGQAGGTANTITGNNGVIDAGLIGVFMPGTDCGAHGRANYSDIGNDANEAWGESSFTRGFGNDNWGDFSTVLGSDNYMAPSSGSFMFSQRSSSYGNLSFTVGRVVHNKANNNYTFGTGKDNTLDSLYSLENNSFNVAFNNQFKFQVRRDSATKFSGMAGSWHGNPVVVNIDQEDNGGYAMLFTNKRASSLPGMDFVGTAIYLGNDGDYWLEAKHSRFGNYLSSEFGLNPKLGLITLNPAINGPGTISLWKNINLESYSSLRNDGVAGKVLFTDTRGDLKLGTIGAGTPVEGSVLTIVNGVPTWVPPAVTTEKNKFGSVTAKK